MEQRFGGKIPSRTHRKTGSESSQKDKILCGGGGERPRCVDPTVQSTSKVVHTHKVFASDLFIRISPEIEGKAFAPENASVLPDCFTLIIDNEQST